MSNFPTHPYLDFYTVSYDPEAPGRLGGDYICTVKNDYGSDFGEPIRVKLPFRKTGQTAPQKRLTVELGDSLNINCNAPLPSGSEVIRVWNYGNFSTIPVRAMRRLTALNHGDILFFSNMISKDNDLSIRCMGHDPQFPENFYAGDSYYISVTGDPKNIRNRAPKIFANNDEKRVSRSIKIGASMRLECGSSGQPTPDIQWKYMKDGKEQQFPSGMEFLERNSSLVVESVTTEMGGTYRCLAKNKAGLDVKDFEMSIKEAPNFVKTPQDRIVYPQRDNKVDLECQISGNPMPSIKWKKNGEELRSEDGEITVSGTTSVLSVKAAKQTDSATYQCEAENSIGNIATAVRVLIIEQAPRLSSDSSSSSSRQTVYVVEGRQLTMDCSLFGFPEPEFSWNNAPSSCAGKKICIVENVKNVLDYSCTGKNDLGSGEIYFNVKKLKSSSISIRKKISINKGDKLELKPKIDTDSQISDYVITWTKKGSTLASRSGYKPQSNYVINRTDFADRGEYTVRIKTQYDEAEGTVEVVVQGAPEPPMNINVKNIDKGVEVSLEPGFNNYAEINKYTVDGLVPFTLYEVRVKAHNPVGSSSPSMPDDAGSSQIRTKPKPPSINPTFNLPSQQAPKELIIKWNAIPPENYNGPDFQYVLEYCAQPNPDNCEICENGLSWKTETFASPNLEFAISGVSKPYQRYSLRIRSKNSEGVGPRPQCQFFFSGEDLPSSAPTGLSVDSRGKTFLELKWNALQQSKANGKIVEYIVKYKESDDDENNMVGSENEVRAKSESLRLDNLKPAKKYRMKVAAVNSAGVGPFSNFVDKETLEDRPGPPVDLQVMSVWPDKVNIVWKQPKNPNGQITAYIYQADGLPIDNPGSQNYHTVAQESAGYSKSRMDVANLKPNHKYDIKLYAKTSAGQGEVPGVISVSTISIAEARPTAPTDVSIAQTTGGVNITWSYEENEQTPYIKPNNYTILYRNRNSDQGVGWSKETVTHRKRPGFLLDGLPPGENYTLVIMASNKYGNSENTTAEFSTEDGPNLETNLWFVAVLVGTGGTLLLIIIVCFVQHNKSGKYPVQTKQELIIDDPEQNIEDRNLLHPHSPRSDKNSAGYGNSELRKVSSESDSITGFGAEGGVTRHYTENGSFIGLYGRESNRESEKSEISPHSDTVADLKTFGKSR
ncbi:Oidioi.mRNA.OKI2018_I69.chr2.g5030.t1.cds [Oikopleura dioica]|uniref:Oidioi.mRNA.OKI2018_I69.chr2.g5030.t1.cds n=1 Tax=Oikopleura dioica TaxID=34765 RepID=A0ABN7SZA3_OIKDI|nr:Oidioi.mRNA.OKI2018_I69.chr2.g5030.t1.cds [Oikopleura dioica]